VGVSRECPNFLGTPYYFRNGKSYRFQTWPVHSGGPSDQKPIKIFGEKAAWAYPGTAQFFPVPPIIAWTGKATDFKFGQYIQGVHPTKSPLKILEKMERGRIQGLPNFSGYPLLSRGTDKATNFKFCMKIYRLNRNKSPLKILIKVTMSVVRTPKNFQGTHMYRHIARSSLRQLSFLVFYAMCIPDTISILQVWSDQTFIQKYETSRSNLISRYHYRPWNYFPSISTYVITVPERYRRTDGRTDDIPVQYCRTAQVAQR